MDANELHAVESLNLNDSVVATAKARMNLALHHLFAACRFSVQIRSIETANTGQPFGDFWEEILHNSLGVAALTVAALESYANEMYFEGHLLKQSVNEAAAQVLAGLVDRESILDKYEVALVLYKGKRLDRGSEIVQNVDALIRLRNATMHFRPEWFDEQVEHDKLSKRLKNRFQPSVFLPSTEPIFPRTWASYSFSVWALRSTVAFIEHFHAESGSKSPLEMFKPHLAKLSDGAI